MGIYFLGTDYTEITTDFFCHAEQSEASPSVFGEILRVAQNDRYMAKPFKICVNLSHQCHLCAMLTQR